MTGEVCQEHQNPVANIHLASDLWTVNRTWGSWQQSEVALDLPEQSEH